MGAPDLLPKKKSQLNHAYKMMESMSRESCRAVAVQNGNYIGDTATTENILEINIVQDLYEFASLRLDVQYIFWVKQEPYFSSYVTPYIRKCNNLGARTPREPIELGSHND